ncbi:MAG: glycoside hydrolase family 25 protein [Lachnospiraceae bacterium]|nr:glycoside hydrolase family 25 protein [Lachnospiraceae bacterium]
MKLNDDNFYSDKKGDSLKLILSVLGALALFSLVILAVLMLNADKLSSNKKSVVRVEDEKDLKSDDNDEGDPFPEGEYTGSGLTSDDLDFWNMYGDKDSSSSKKSVSPDEILRKYTSDSLSDSTRDEDDGDNADGVQAVERDDEGTFNCADSGEEELLEIDENIPRNTYSSDFFRQEGNELQYYSSGRKVSSYGIDVSKYQGKIDWEKVAASGIDFAMIRMGVRGYSTGAVVFDERFEENIKGANDNGIDVGIYFYSQAKDQQEAVEEANYAVAAAAAHKVSYPIVFYSEEITGEPGRTEGLDPEQLSGIAKRFCDTVNGYGYRSMIGASKHRLSKDMSPGLLDGYDVWLVDAAHLKEGEQLTMSEYPYRYTMWQYSSNGRIDGIDDAVDLDISFVDYKYR